MVISDGYSEETERLAGSWKQGSTFSFHFETQAESGKHVAINKAVQRARGELVLVVDDDDRMLPEGVASILRVWTSIRPAKKLDLCGLMGLNVDAGGKVIGSRYPKEGISSTIEMLYRQRVRGDKPFVAKRELLLRYPFPENLGSFVPESTVWNQLWSRYLTLHQNLPLVLVEYQSGGLSARSREVRLGSWQSSYYYNLDLAGLAEKRKLWRAHIRAAANLGRYAFHGMVPIRKVMRDLRLIDNALPRAATAMVAGIVGPMLAVLDRIVLRMNVARRKSR